MKPGTRVQIKGLLNASMHNGKVGTVTSATTVDNRIPVKIDDDFGNVLAVKAENLDDVTMEFEYTGEIPVPKSVTFVRFHSSISKVKNEAFKDCKQLKEVVFNEGLRKIGKDAFEDCRSLESITLPSTVVEIGKHAFCDCRNLREIVLNEGLKQIGHNSFWECDSLESIIIPSTVQLIGREAFDECNSLSRVELNIPREIKFNAFRNCESLDGFKFSITARLNTIIQTGLTDIENKIYQIPGIQRSGGIVQWRPGDELFVHRRSMRGGENWPQIRQIADKISELVVYYELREATTLFELALWKSKIDQADKTNDMNREAYRIDVPGPVKDTLLQLLGSADADDSSMESDGDSDDDSSLDESDSDGSFTDRMLDYFEQQAGVPDPFL